MENPPHQGSLDPPPPGIWDTPIWLGGLNFDPLYFPQKCSDLAEIFQKVVKQKLFEKQKNKIIVLTSTFDVSDVKNADFRDAATEICPLRKS